MTRRLLSLGCLVLCIFSCALTYATPSTLIWIPSTDIQPAASWHLGVDNYFTPTNGSRSPTDIGITYGFADNRAEIGLDYLGGQDDPVCFNAKCLLLAETGDRPRVVAGAFNFGTESGVTDYNMLYLLGSRTLGQVRLTLGYCHGNEDTLGRDPDMLLAGVDGYLDRAKKWWGSVDYQSGENAFGALSVGVAYSFADNVSLIVGYTFYNDAAIADTITTQWDVNF